MEEDTKQQEPFLKTVVKKIRGMHTLDRIALIVFTIIVVIAAVIISQHLIHNRELTVARVTADKTTNALREEDTKTLIAMGDADFKKTTSASKLKTALTFNYNNTSVTFKELYGSTKPTVDWTQVVNNSVGQHVVFIYKYNRLKVPYYVRIDTINPAGKNHWYLQALSFSADESKLQTGVESSPSDDTTTDPTTLTQSI